MLRSRRSLVFALALGVSLAFHLGLLLSRWSMPALPAPEATLPLQLTIVPRVKPPPPESRKARPLKPVRRQAVSETPAPPQQENLPKSMSAPPTPTAEEWQLASTYTPRNGKRYRYTWGQQVRSMMGTAVEGKNQGMVRFRIELAPDGTLTKVEELWSTSAVASKLAWKAIQHLPPLPPTPSGKPLIFEQTISFLPYETGWPPSYKLDCLPEPQPFNNPYAWDGTSAPSVAPQDHRPPPSADCPPDSTEDTIEAEEKSFNRQMDQWRWGR